MDNEKAEEHWVRSKLNEFGAEIMDPKPLFQKLGFKKPPTLEQKLQQYLAAQRQEMQEQLGYDPKEEMNFDIDDDPDMLSPYEAEVMVMEQEQLDTEAYAEDQRIREENSEDTTKPDDIPETLTD